MSTPPPKVVDASNVDEVIGVAAQLAQAQKDTLTVEELQQIGAQLDLAPEHIARAVEVLEARQKEAEARRAARTRQLRIVAVVALALLALGALGAVLSGRSTTAELQAAWEPAHSAQTRADSLRAQLVAAQQRRADVERTLTGPLGDAAAPDRAALLEGALNRVGIARRRFADAASSYASLAEQYNRTSRGAWARFWAARAGLPASLPSSLPEPPP